MPDRVLVVLVAGDLLPAFPENAASAVEGGRWREAIAVRRSASDTSKQIEIERGMFSRVMKRWQRQPLAGSTPRDSVSLGSATGLEAPP